VACTCPGGICDAGHGLAGDDVFVATLSMQLYTMSSSALAPSHFINWLSST
jgi:hypothetical protein